MSICPFSCDLCGLGAVDVKSAVNHVSDRHVLQACLSRDSTHCRLDIHIGSVAMLWFTCLCTCNLLDATCVVPTKCRSELQGAIRQTQELVGGAQQNAAEAAAARQHIRPASHSSNCARQDRLLCCPTTGMCFSRSCQTLHIAQVVAALHSYLMPCCTAP